MPLVISIVGKSSTGKTTFLEKLIRELSVRGYKVATIKHSHHSISFDDPSKDSWRHARAGAAATVVSSTTEIQIIKPIPSELTAGELARYLGEDYDIILTEGFSRGDAPKIEIHRKEAGPLLDVAVNLFAVVTDEPLETTVPQFGLGDVKEVADLLEEGYIQPNLERLSLYINGRQIPLPSGSVRLIHDVLKALDCDLQDNEEIRGLELRYHKDSPSSHL
ncbi:MAG: molybdopterin-guanine dinucleotide biosynthesis protein B [Dehalococcoidales bacterium]|nr:molybdopterin-guanine dinucleotide biosynthesis protein B [Dehalococcoidales bacterium]